MLKALTALTLGLLLYGGLRGYYSWDYFTLWGVHAKAVWASGRFFLPGSELALPMSYQSVLGSFVGILARVLSPDRYPDFLLGLCNVLLLSALLFASVSQATRTGKLPKDRAWAFLAIALALIRPVEWGQVSWGGYQDFSSALCLALALMAHSDRRFGTYVAWTLLGLALRPVNWPWWVLGAAAWNVQEFRRPWKALPAFVVPVSCYLLLKLAYDNAPPLPGEAAPIVLSSWDRLRLPVVILLTHTGGVAVALALALSCRPLRDKSALFALGSVAYLALLFNFVIGQTPHETYPSLYRYTLPLYLVLVVTLMREGQRIFGGGIKRGRLLMCLLALAAAVRGLEDISIIRRDGGPARLASFTDRFPEVVAKAEELRLRIPEGCAGGVWRGAPHLALDKLQVVYAALPARLYFENSPTRPTAENCVVTEP